MTYTIEWIIAEQVIKDNIDKKRDQAVIVALFSNKDKPDEITPLTLWEGKITNIPVELGKRKVYDWLFKDAGNGFIFLFELIGTPEDMEQIQKEVIKKRSLC